MTDEKVLEILGTHPDYVTKAQIGWLSPAQIGWLSRAQIGGLSDCAKSYVMAARNNKDVPAIDKPYTAILKAINAEGCSLQMSSWHSCKTTHCLGGWTVHLAGAEGYEAEKKYGGTPKAAALILLKSRPDAPLPNFYASNEAALAFIKARANEESQPSGEGA